MKRILNFVDYLEALEWIEKEAKNYKSMNDFYSSKEYKLAYPLIKLMYDVEQLSFIKKAKSELKKAKLKVGDHVYYNFVSPFFNVVDYTGKIIERTGIPYVKFDDGQKTMSGKKSIRWHKGFVKSN